MKGTFASCCTFLGGKTEKIPGNIPGSCAASMVMRNHVDIQCRCQRAARLCIKTIHHALIIKPAGQLRSAVGGKAEGSFLGEQVTTRLFAQARWKPRRRGFVPVERVRRVSRI